MARFDTGPADGAGAGAGDGAAPATATATACPYCGVGCGVLATPRADGTAAIRGDRDHPANFGRLCSKGSALGETLSLDDRLLHPEIGGRKASWEEAIDLVAGSFSAAMSAHGPDSVAIYGSGQLLTEDYYVANKLMKGFIGTANMDTNSRLCMASSVAGHIRAFGSDTVPGTYADLDEADLVVLVGSNLAWCHPILHQRLMAAKEQRGTRIVTIDPRRTATAETADLHLPIAPNGDVALFAGLLAHLARCGHLDRTYLDTHTSGLSAALATSEHLGLPEVAALTGLDEEAIAAFYQWWAATERVVTVYSQGVNQSVAGTDKVNAIINCHLATGRIGRPGMGPFSVTGQPNAMGGREVGGLANMLAAHMSLGNADHARLVGDFWQSDRLATRPGLKAVDLFRAVADGRVKAIWIISTNPVDSMPEANLVRAALAACPFVAVSDMTRTDTTALAHVLLPAAAWGEKSGTVTNSERRISRQRAFRKPPGEARPDWRIICDVAIRMGFGKAFAFRSPADIFREHAALSSAGNNGSRDFDLGALADIDDAGYAALAPLQWPQPTNRPPRTEDQRFFAEGGFFTPDRRARLVPTPVEPPRPASPGHLILNTGRIRDQWHTMTRTAKAPRLMAHYAEPFCEIHPDDAAAAGIAPATIMRLANRSGEILARALVTERQRRGSVFVPMHWTDQIATRARIDILASGTVDPVSGQPELKRAEVTVSPYAASWYAFAVMRNRPPLPAIPYGALARAEGGWRLELAGDDPAPPEAMAAMLLGPNAAHDSLTYADPSRGIHRFAAFDEAGLVGALWMDREPVAVSRTWAAALLTDASSLGAHPSRILSGRPAGDMPDAGALVCACFSIGANQIARAIDDGAGTVSAVSEATRAGTNCGSCRSEIARMLRDRCPVPA